ncbi:MAG: T9SS type A sorting domain-containing protein [candidate division KSB1 bacterium]|nr:T9SS type A sorting domain-containing protein [candidate division KSB1 bacterium]
MAVAEASPDQPNVFYLYPNYPNPFNRNTWIEYSLPRNTEVTLDLLDVTGRRIRRLLHRWQPVGHYRIKLEAGNLASGLYLYRLTAAPYRQTRKLLLLK